MKKYICILLISFFTFSCEEVIDIDLEDSEPRLVIDAFFNLYNNDTNTSAVGAIKLSLTAPFFDDEIEPVTNATVFITNLNDNSVVNFVDILSPGYFTPTTSAGLQPELNTNYELTVIYDNETYTSTTQLIPTVPIDIIEQGDGFLFEDTEKEVIITFTDDVTRDDFYLFNLGFQRYILTQDEFYQGQTFNFSYFYDEEFLEEQYGTENQEITIQIFGVEEAYYNYFNLVLEQAETDGSPFQTIPALVKGNIINITNEDNFPLGYFRISESYTASITLED